MWSANLVVGLDQERGLLSPRVHLHGRPEFERGALRVELIDERRALRHLARRPLRPEQLGTELRLPSFRIPFGVGAEEVVRWSWEIAVETDGAERIRWRRYLEGESRIGAEGEIELAGPAAELRPKVEDEGWGPEAPWDRRDSERLLLKLVEEGLIEPRDRAEVLAERVMTGRTVERILAERGLLSERDVLSGYAEVSGCEFVELARYPIDPEAVAIVPERVARHFGLVGIGFERGPLTVATSDPQRDPGELAPLYDFIGAPVYIVVATRPDVLAVLDARPLGPEALDDAAIGLA